MMKLRFAFILLVIYKITKSQQQQIIPPASESGYCTCQFRPFKKGFNVDLQYKIGVVKFKLFTRSSLKDEGQLIEVGNAQSLLSSGFNPDKKLTVICHGWREDPEDSKWINPMKDALLLKEDMNLIIVNWASLAFNFYKLAAQNSKYTGKLLGKFLHFIKNIHPGFSGRQVHLIGFSMGAHSVGIAGHNFPGIGRITGLDPAAPSYECIPDSEYLDSSDATFVDNIHTNSGCLSRGHYGYRIPTGHQDFYVNGGGKQPGCPNFFLDAFDDFLTRRNYVCHHSRSIDYFTESILARDTTYGFSCSDYATFKTGGCHNNAKAVFGYKAAPTVRGTFFLTTEGSPSYLTRHIHPVKSLGEEPSSYPMQHIHPVKSLGEEPSSYPMQHIIVKVQIGSGGDRVTRGDFTLQINGRNGKQKKIILLRYNQMLRSNEVISGMLTYSLAIDISQLEFIFRYEYSGFKSIAGNDYIDIIKIIAVATSSDQEYCVSPRVSFLKLFSYHLRPRLGSC